MEIEPLKLLKKIAEAKPSFPKIYKNSDNPFFKSKYEDLEEVLKVEEILLKKEIIIRTFQKEFLLITRITDLESGEYIESVDVLRPENNSQQRGSENTYSRRYAIKNLLNLISVDDDGNDSSISQPQKNNLLDINGKSRTPSIETPIGYEATKEHKNMYFSPGGMRKFKETFNVELDKKDGNIYVYAPLGTYEIKKNGGTSDLSRPDYKEIAF